MKRVIGEIFCFLRIFLVFSAIISFVITCSFLLSFSSIELAEEDVRAFAPILFANIFVLAGLSAAFDFIRRKITVDKPVREIKNGLKKLMRGDFGTRIKAPKGQFGEIAESINLLAEELSGVETLRTDFIANVSHELKTPLAVMQNYGTMLQSPDITEEQRTEYAKAISDACRRLASLITNILKLNKLENQQIFPASREYDLSEQLCECLLRFEDLWERKGIDIETEIEDGIAVISDPELLELVWSNLLSNAFKFTETGGKVSASVTADEEYAIVKISDTGCGMSQETGSHIFEKFYQGDSSHSSQGNGLGLALVKRVTDILQGEINVESTLGKGSSFTVKIKRNTNEK